MEWIIISGIILFLIAIIFAYKKTKPQTASEYSEIEDLRPKKTTYKSKYSGLRKYTPAPKPPKQ